MFKSIELTQLSLTAPDPSERKPGLFKELHYVGDLFNGWHTMPSISSGFAQMCNRFPCKLDFHVVLKQNISEAAPPYFSCDNISLLLSAASVACSVLRWIKPVFKW